MGNLKLSSQDYMAVTRAMDSNRNNRIDRNEATISYNAHRNIGNSNGVAGTRELANSLAEGDVYLNNINPETADKIAAYFSKRNENFDRPVSQWVSDAWISKDDLELPYDVKDRIDRNGDNRISTREFANALSSGSLTIGESRQVGQNPFHEPSHHDAYDHNPFHEPAPYHNDPFRDPVRHEPYHNSYPSDAADAAAGAVVGGLLLIGLGAALLSQDKE
ncbi:hypothetical protein COW36_17815 [bacterium (Candidatus Blackallbacteria) CG17_big_fil_post_rev_8_21_14_2_50_48_46]|uniref:EF-hand domain-containing protein n=1 Tax=bacterium (Candidatus Blackallbacteria) CG17_big_fil_post_rev_8_21_14_2_50_48_46 TaxID=2014261 RepID=A0A2M7G0N4_9BACT|nr:MAG: hypothetical protein COW64_00910 [bacterium (Candidatus Blackallbacteria) CG18_big_fil_WC_8_21_14_2_50_49_26]PIW15274.1 MAG: hypothetical protein COW36_17815 [bacterium (Candidatus Blackallbacteria) CG17_big_fil_post_rev_8_21_14_2_50_48_46]PIW45217.1 MAG: hypothetical protein COW20_21200 [bacterium (Candidatus Blackallbacteria) CG13_big_fil_rev_8_21_14_2_50_49_14]